MIFQAPELDYYEQFLPSKLNFSVTLSREEAAVVLKAYDHGISSLKLEEVALLDKVLAELKNGIHP
jgi:hypothetical protein